MPHRYEHDVPETAATTTLLIRHAHTDSVGVCLDGRTAGVHLNDRGKAEADRLGRSLAVDRLSAIYVSPLERAVETAQAISVYQRIPITVCEELCEIDFGTWTGKLFAELDDEAEWCMFNSNRATATVPEGEPAIAAQQRIVAALERLALSHRGETIAIVSHSDLLRYALLHYATLSLDEYDTFQIAPASVSALVWLPCGPRLLYVNNLRFAGVEQTEGSEIPDPETEERS